MFKVKTRPLWEALLPGRRGDGQVREVDSPETRALDLADKCFPASLVHADLGTRLRLLHLKNGREVAERR
jgi:hypothetical protein